MLRAPQMTPGDVVPHYIKFLKEISELTRTSQTLNDEEKNALRVFISRRISTLQSIPFGSDYSTRESPDCHVSLLRSMSEEIDPCPGNLSDTSIEISSSKDKAMLVLLSKVIDESSLKQRASELSGELFHYADHLKKENKELPTFAELYGG